MKIALISTVFNEAASVARWIDALSAQTVQPDEFVIVDGGSTDGTVNLLKQGFERAGFPKPRIIAQRCNIAEGRNIAIRQTDAGIIAANDAGSFPEPEWFGEITRPLIEDPHLDVVGGRTILVGGDAFQNMVMRLEKQMPDTLDPDNVYPSSRCTAFRRQAWADVGGYPEWLTLTAEDSLFNFGLHKISKAFRYNCNAVVRWPMRETPAAYFKMLYSYGFGAAEARLYTADFLRRLRIVVFPPYLLVSRRLFSHFWFRYRQNVTSCAGWIAGLRRGRRPPPGWKRVEGVLLSPEAQKHLSIPDGPR